VISETVNLAAKLEKHNKAENAKALTTKTALELAILQGYQPPQPKEIRLKRDVAGASESIDVAVLA
jgi:adenylate cyclase